MSIRTILVGLVAIAALSVAPARAELLYFSYVGATSGMNSGDTASWIQLSNPTPLAVESGIFTNVLVSDGMTNFGPTRNVVSFVGGPPSCCGGFGTDGENGGVGDAGVQIFAGSFEMPIFSVGTFNMDSGTLTVTAVPEPSTWAMMLIGLLGLGYAGHRRSRRNGASRAA